MSICTKYGKCVFAEHLSMYAVLIYGCSIFADIKPQPIWKPPFQNPEPTLYIHWKTQQSTGVL